MNPRHIIIPALVLGLAGVGLYAAPCLMGPCEDEAPVANEDADAPCDMPCDHPCDGDKAKALAAGEANEEPCPFAEKAKAEAALAAAAAEGDEKPCPHALDKHESEAQLAAQVENQGEGQEAAPVDGAPKT